MTNLRRWAIASLAAFIAIFVIDLIAHGHLLMGLYNQTASVWRPQVDAKKMMWMMTLGQIIFAMIFAFIYTKGYEPNKSGLAQGLRYGFWMGLLTCLPYVFIWYVVLPVPCSLALGWLVAGLADCIVAGALVGLLYRQS